ncbi:MAG: hypothetical protein MI919_15005, partial [Holophagales bacterium]|nr:hypothetical protein [Holophagales bacterium]
IALGITVLAITDHNSAEDVPYFLSAAAPHEGLHIFPGLELRSSEGVHVLCIYPKETDKDQIGRFLGEFGIRDPESKSELSDKSFLDILAKVRHQGGVTIAAHTTGKNGLLRSLDGQARIRAWRSEDLLAVQIPGTVDDLPHNERTIVQNRNADYRREPSPEDKLAVAVLNAKDVTAAAELEDPAASCWIKMSEVSVEGLRQAFLDPGSRIRLRTPEGEHQPDEHTELLALAWEGGFLDGAGIRFNSNLNVLIGGRGAGKSTIVESLRAVLELDAVGDDARSAHEGIVRHVLKNGTKIYLRARIHHPARREYTIERTLPNPSIVRDEHGEISSLTPRDVLPRIEIYGQHEISELAKSRHKLTRLLDRFVDRQASSARRKQELQRQLEKNRQGLLNTRDELERTGERLDRLPGLEETLERFRDAGLEERLQEKSLLVKEERLLATVPERLDFARESLEILRQNLPLDRVFLSAKAIEELPGKALLARADEILARLGDELERIARELQEALEHAEGEMGSVRTEWASRQSEAEAAYEKILRELQKEKVDGEEFIRLRKQIEELQPLREKRNRLRETEQEHRRRRRELLAQWEDLKAEEFRHLERAAKKVGRKLRERVEVRVTAAGNREPLFALLREEIGGRLSEAIDALRRAEDLSLSLLVETLRAGARPLSRRYRLTPGQAESLAGAEESTLLRLEELDLPPTTEIRLNTAPAGEPAVWQSLEQLSTGQKATAVLLLLLLESDAPLVVDQPEDDLDNRFITEGIVPRMREEKQRRQFIFSTHNANIPVLGDAELIVGLSPHGEAEHGSAQISPEHMGSIDDQSVRELVEEVLEGGKEAFERRRRKYGF